MTIKLVTGNVQEALQTLRPSVLLNISDTTGTGAHVLCGVLYRDYPVYTEMLNRVKYNKTPTQSLIGKYCYTNVGDQTHVLAFTSAEPVYQDPNLTYIGMNTSINPPLINILSSLNTDMLSSGKRSIIIPYYGKPHTGYGFTEFVDLVGELFDAGIIVYISVTHQFASYGDTANMMVLRFTSPVTSNGKRTIYAKQNVPQHFERPMTRYPDLSRGSPNMVNVGWITPQSCA